MATIYYARRILLPDMTILDHGGVSVENGRIIDVAHRGLISRTHADRAVNLGETLLMPGLINLHTHLEESAIRLGLKDIDSESFASYFMKKESRLRNIDETDLVRPVQLAIRHMLACGTTTVVNTGRSSLIAKILATEPIRAWSILEIGQSDKKTIEKLDAFLDLKKSLEEKSSRLLFGVGPHAIFSLPPHTQQLLREKAKKNELLYSVHCAESAEELLAFCEQKGDLYFFITKNQEWPFGKTPLGSLHYALEKDLLPEHMVAIHCNYSTGNELVTLNAKSIFPVLCFTYNQSRGHKPFPLDVALDRSVKVCLGTETQTDLGFGSMFDELFALKQEYPHRQSAELLTLATKNPACALGMPGKLGELSKGAYADMIGISLAFSTNDTVLDVLLLEEGEMRLVMVNGEEIVANY